MNAEQILSETLIVTRERRAALDQNPDVLANEYRSKQASDRHDYVEAAKYAAIARDAAQDAGDIWGYYRSSFGVAHFQYVLGRMDDCIGTVKTLVEHPDIGDYPELVAQARVLLAHALQESGASESAHTAVKQASNVIPVNSGQLRLKVQHSVVSTLAEQGRVEEAWREALALDAMVGREEGPRVRGMACWAIGNAAFMSGRVEQGQDYHFRAAQALAAVGDVNLWAQFNKAAANMRIETELLDEVTSDYLERAEVAFSVAGGSDADQLEILLARAKWEFASGNGTVAEQKLRDVVRQSSGSFPYIHAQTLQVLASCLHKLGRSAEALRTAGESKRMFERLGALERASQIEAVIRAIREDHTGTADA